MGQDEVSDGSCNRLIRSQVGRRNPNEHQGIMTILSPTLSEPNDSDSPTIFRQARQGPV